jgi:Concanavalin A-like lectin/glucanases superfamily/Secretion system C-terminal sorting domain/BNR repeat-containing family member
MKTAILHSLLPNTKKIIFLFSLLINNVIYCQTPTYYWSMDNTTVQGSTPFTIQKYTNTQVGKFGGAYYTQRGEQGNDTSISIIQSPNINLTKQGKYTLTAWINVAAYPKYHLNGVENHLISKIDQGNQFALLMDKNGELKCRIWDISNTLPVELTASVLPLNRWVHVALVVDYQTKLIKLYLNGVVNKTGEISGLPNGSNGNLIFGNTTPTGDYNKQYWGAFDEVKLYNDQVLTDDFILNEASKDITPDHLWRFNQDLYPSMQIKDFMGYADLDITPNVTFAPGKMGATAIVFDSSDDKAKTNTGVSFTQNGNYSVSFWINPNSYPASGEGVIFNKRQTSNQIGCYILADGKLRTNIWGSGNGFLRLTSNASIPKNTWTHIAITLESKNKKANLYINKNTEVTSALTFTPNTATDILEIGNTASGNGFKGMIDNFGVYKNKVLTTSEINNIYTKTEQKGIVNTPIRVNHFGQTEVRQFDYEPKFVPNEVTFDAANRPYMRIDKYVQTLDENKNWVRYDFTAAIKVAYPDWDGGADIKPNLETRVVFDAQDWAYIHVNTAYRTNTPALKTTDLILYSSDYCKTWKVLSLGRIAKNVNWEIISTNDPVVNPPVLLSEDGGAVYIQFFNKSGNILQLQKRVKIADSAGLQVSHSGHGKGAISSGDNLVHVCYYGSVTDPSGDIGTPMYVKTINRNDFTMTPAFYLGSIGNSVDGHNYPVIEMDSKKVLHICFAGHHTKVVYRYSTIPNSTATWSTPVDIIDPKTTNQGHGNTYSSLVIDKEDNLHYTSRYSGINYTFTVSYMTKPSGRVWQANEQLLFPRLGNYHVWLQHLSLDRKGNFYLNYSFSHQQSVPFATYSNYNNEYPEAKLTAKVPVNGVETIIVLGQNENLLPPGERVNSTCQNLYAGMLTLRNGEVRWRLATTPDFTSAITTVVLNTKESELIKKAIDMYPNPTKSVVTITGLSIGDSIKIYDLLGKIVLNTMAKQDDETISTAGFTSGMYIVAVGEKARLKLIKE